MSAIFVSHSSKDQAATAAMQQWLQAQGHQSIFLDFDPADGIPAGVSWEQELYQRLRGCRAVIALLSDNWLRSRWCFTEVTQARALGKAVFPARVAACDASGVLPDIQHIDLTADPGGGYRRLEEGLKRAGLDPRKMFHWDADRPPYPGLLAFQEQDAAIFFGREDEISDGLDTLNRLRRQGGGQLVLFLGASGSGKSSLVRAGLLLRLRRDLDNWLPLPPFRPQEKPLDELAMALADSLKGGGDARSWQALRAELQRAAGAEPPDGAALIDLARDLQIAAGRREATVLLVVDQAEELLGYGRSEEADRFLRLLRSALGAGGTRLMALATMRSDFLGEFQTQRSLVGLAYETVTVGPISARNLPPIIERPAEVAGIELGPGLVATLLHDAETEDALPLLAFTLRELYERYGADRRLELEEYRQLGGLEGSVRRAADGVIEAARPSEVELEELRGAFVPAMVRINEEGQYARRRALRADLPPRVQALLQRFVDARLLVADRDEAGRDTLEVAHEALLRAWPRLRGWLDADQDNLRLRETVRRAAQEWNQRGRGVDWLDHRGSRLEAVEALLHEPRFALKDETERDYVQACVEQRRREQEEAEAAARAEKDRLAAEARAARQIARRTLIGAVVSLCLAAAAGVGGYVAYQNRLEAEQNALEAEHQRDVAAHQRDLAEKALAERKRAESTRLAALSQQRSGDDPSLGLQLALLALPDVVDGVSNHPDTDAAAAALASAVLRDHEVVLLKGHHGPVLTADFSPDAALVVTASSDGSARVWSTATGTQRAVLQDDTDDVYSARFSPDGQRVVTASADDTARIWDAATGATLVALEGHEGDVYTAEFSPDGATVVTASDDATARLWKVATGEAQAVLRGHREWLWGAWFSPEGRLVATASADDTARIWDAAEGTLLFELDGHGDDVTSARFSPDEAYLVTASSDKTARIWDTATGKELATLSEHGQAVLMARFSPDGQRVVTASSDQTARIWDAATGATLVALKGHEGDVYAAEFGPEGKDVVTASADGTARVWDAGSGAELAVLRPHSGEVKAARFSPDGQRVVTASDDARAGLWWVRRFDSFAELLAFAKQTERKAAASPWRTR